MKGKLLQLVSLELQQNGLSCPMMDCLAKASWPALRELNLGLTSMARHDAISDGLLLIFSRLEVRNLSNPWLSNQTLEQLKNMHWAHLRSMGLANSFGIIGSKGVEFLGNVTWPLLESLDLRQNTLLKEAMTALTQPQFLQLKQLHLDQTDLVSDICALDHLLSDPDFNGISKVDEGPDNFVIAF